MSAGTTNALSPVAAAAATAAALCILPSIASAQYTPGQAWVSSGFAFSASFGRQVEVGLSMDLRLTGLLNGTVDPGCAPAVGAGLGPYAQAGWYSRTGWRFGLGLHGGGTFAPGLASADGELGWSYRRRLVRQSPEPDARPDNPAVRVAAGESSPSPNRAAGDLPTQEADLEVPGKGTPAPPPPPPPPADPFVGSHGLHFGFVLEIVPPPIYFLGFQLPLGFELPLSGRGRGPAFAAGLGTRLPNTFGVYLQSICTPGRPLRENGVAVLPAVLVGSPCGHRDLDEPLRSALADAWLHDARVECASIPVFYALARDLAVVGAPPSLIARALAAAEQEVHHTVLCRQLAASFAGVSLTPLIPPVPAANDPDRISALCRLATEAWLDGCIGEAAAAAQAQQALQVAADQQVRTTLATIARDEAEHAELAWSVLAFCLAAGGRYVRESVAALVLSPDGARAGITSSAESSLPGEGIWHPARYGFFGRLSPHDEQTIWHRTALRARSQVERLFFARDPRRRHAPFRGAAIGSSRCDGECQ